MDFIRLPHSIYSKDENGRILAEIRFPETEPGCYNIESTYVAEEYIGTELPDQLVGMACDIVKEAGGRVTGASCPFAYRYLRRHPQ